MNDRVEIVQKLNFRDFLSAMPQTMYARIIEDYDDTDNLGKSRDYIVGRIAAHNLAFARLSFVFYFDDSREKDEDKRKETINDNFDGVFLDMLDLMEKYEVGSEELKAGFKTGIADIFDLMDNEWQAYSNTRADQGREENRDIERKKQEEEKMADVFDTNEN